MPAIYTQTYRSPFGELILGSFDNQLCLCDWKYRKMRTAIDARLQKFFDANFNSGETEVLALTKLQLNAYFKQALQTFDVPVCFAGTAFQQKVWQSLKEIPFGQTLTYTQLAESLGDVKAIRAVATANGANAISIIVPCHRIVGKSGELVGYAGGLDAKRRLLKLEGVHLKTPSNQIQLSFLD